MSAFGTVYSIDTMHCVNMFKYAKVSPYKDPGGTVAEYLENLK